MVARFDPAAKTVTVLSIPRDLWVDIPGDVSGISGMNRINAAFNSGSRPAGADDRAGPRHPVNHYMSVDFPGFSGMVNALGGITMDFPTPVKDQYTGLDVTTTGCQVVNGTTALRAGAQPAPVLQELERLLGVRRPVDFSRIQRQDAFFRAVLAKVNASITNPLAINSFIGASVGNLTIDDTLARATSSTWPRTSGASRRRTSSPRRCPTIGYTTDGGASVLKLAQPYAQDMIDSFNAIGTQPAATTPVATPAKGKHATTTTTVPTEAHSQVLVNVLNASTVNDIAHSTGPRSSPRGSRSPRSAMPRPSSPQAVRRRSSTAHRLQGGADAGLGVEWSRHLRRRLGPQRSDGLAPHRWLPAHRDRSFVGELLGVDDDHRSDDDDHDHDSG